MQKTKKQKYEQQVRKSLKTIINLQPELVQFLKGLPLKNDTLISKSFPYIHGLKLLRIMTLMEINFVIFSFLDILQKTKVLKAQNLKIGIIGGGLMGRLILNTLLVFVKQGLKMDNIYVSTRQPQHLQFYADNFGVKTFFDNQKIASQCDFIFLATPATLDNWIIADLKRHLDNRINSKGNLQTNQTSYASTVAIQHSQPINKNTSTNQTQIDRLKKGETQNVSIIKTSKKTINHPIKEENIALNPFVYILTSDFTSQKAKKLFNFPVMMPWIRATDISWMLQQLKIKLTAKDTIQLTQDSQKIIKQLEFFLSQKITDERTENNRQGDQKQAKQSEARMDQIIKVFSYTCKKLQKNWRLNIAFLKQKSQNQIPQNNKLYTEIFKSQGSYAETFLTKSRKWRMAYNNFIV